MLSDIIQPRISELGKIKIGRKSDKVLKTQSGKEWSPPEKLDHIILTTLNRDGKGQLALDVALMNQLKADGYADKDGNIRKLPIRVLSNDPEDIMQSSWCWYGGRNIGARSDGKTVTWFVGHDKENWCKRLPEPVTEPWQPEFEDLADGKGVRLFKQHTIFNCVVASKGSRFGGVHKFRTTSTITASQLYGGLLHVLQLTGGILVGIPLQLVMRPMQVSPEVNGNKVNSTVYVLHLELVGSDLSQIQDQALKQAKFLLHHQQGVSQAVSQYRALLRAPGHEASDAEIVDINEEFHPENVEPREPVKMPKALEPVPAVADEPLQEPDQSPPEPLAEGEIPNEPQEQPVEPAKPTLSAAVADWTLKLNPEKELSLQEFNALLPDIGKLKGKDKRACWDLVEAHAAKFNLVFDKTYKQFAPAEIAY